MIKRRKKYRWNSAFEKEVHRIGFFPLFISLFSILWRKLHSCWKYTVLVAKVTSENKSQLNLSPYTRSANRTKENKSFILIFLCRKMEAFLLFYELLFWNNFSMNCKNVLFIHILHFILLLIYKNWIWI